MLRTAVSLALSSTSSSTSKPSGLRPQWACLSKRRRDIFIGIATICMILHLALVPSAAPFESPLNVYRLRAEVTPEKSLATASPAAFAYWTGELEEDRQIQEFLSKQNLIRASERARLRTAAAFRKAVRNDRSVHGGAPVVVYWPEPPVWWAQFYGTGRGETIRVQGCAVECALVSGHARDPSQRNSHVLLTYNIYKGLIDGVTLDGKRSLEPWQKLALYTMEPNGLAIRHQQTFKFYDIVASFSQYSDIRFETYLRNLCGVGPQGACIGLAELQTREQIKKVFGRNLDRSPFYSPELAAQASLPRNGPGPRIATFISNCNGGTRNRLIKDLVQEGIVFDHYGKCKEDVFGGTPQHYANRISEAAQSLNIPEWSFKDSILALYDFVLIAENTVLSDYISEKVTQGLLAGGVPVVLGAPNLADEIQPRPETHARIFRFDKLKTYPMFIDATRYSPAELALELRKLHEAQGERRKFRHWIRALPRSDLPIIRYAQRTREHDFTNNTYMEPICKLCEFYHENYDWADQVPLKL